MIEDLRGRLVTDETKIGFFQLPVSVYLDYTAFLVKEEKDDPARRRALELTERARARALTDSLLRFDGSRTPERTFGEMPSPVQTHPITYQEMVDLARHDNTHYVSYFIAGDSVYSWVISPLGQTTYFNLPITRHELEHMVNNFRRLIETDGIWIDNKGSQNLFDALIFPLQPAFDNLKAGDRLTIVPHDLLNSIPFSTLLDETHYWGLIYQLTSVPSLTFAHYLNTLAGRSVDSVLAIGKPAGLDGLANSEWEVATVLQIFPKATKLLGEAASKQEVLTKASEYQAILFSTHGRTGNNEYYLELAQEDKLWPRDIQSLDLRKVNVVALSACETHVGHRYSGDELMSLARAFLVSGVDYVLVTLWPVNDLATSKIVTSFFSRLRAGIAPAAALYHAQRDYFGTGSIPKKWV